MALEAVIDLVGNTSPAAALAASGLLPTAVGRLPAVGRPPEDLPLLNPGTAA